jgi:hypothetical protein
MTDQVTPIRKPRKPRSAVQLLMTISAMQEQGTFKVFESLSNDDKFANANLKAAASRILENLEVLSKAGAKVRAALEAAA